MTLQNPCMHWYHVGAGMTLQLRNPSGGAPSALLSTLEEWLTVEQHQDKDENDLQAFPCRDKPASSKQKPYLFQNVGSRVVTTACKKHYNVCTENTKCMLIICDL